LCKQVLTQFYEFSFCKVAQLLASVLNVSGSTAGEAEQKV